MVPPASKIDTTRRQQPKKLCCSPPFDTRVMWPMAVRPELKPVHCVGGVIMSGFVSMLCHKSEDRDTQAQ